MPVRVDDLEVLRRYLEGVLERAKHHAPNVSKVVLPLAGAVVLFKDASSALEVHKGRSGDLANVLWFTRRGVRYACSYDHQQQRVIIKRGSQNGPVIASFDNSTSNGSILSTFEGL